MIWVPHDTRDSIIDFIRYWSQAGELPVPRMLAWIGLSRRKYHDWIQRFGLANEHNRKVPRDHWLEEWEKQAIINYFKEYPLEGYRRLCFMMLDADIVAVSPSSVYRVLSQAGLLLPWEPKKSKKGNGFIQPLEPHDHWHIDFSYLNISGTFFYLCSVLDGCSRYVVAWEIGESMKSQDAALVLQRAREKYPQAAPRIISDNGPQFIAKDFKEYIRHWQTSHVYTSPHYPQSNGKLERFHRTLKEDCLRPQTPLTLEDARRVTGQYIEHYNEVRLHSGIGFITPQAKLEGRSQEIFKERDRKLREARELRARRREEMV